MQGCMNNFTFGNEKMGYYETIAGGGGAGPDWEGESGVHSHMTNTRITGTASSRLAQDRLVLPTAAR
jgi:N-methylhydantoinase B/oxoprolinase/acetone carboxylase alpha subunit